MVVVIPSSSNAPSPSSNAPIVGPCHCHGQDRQALGGGHGVHTPLLPQGNGSPCMQAQECGSPRRLQKFPRPSPHHCLYCLGTLTQGHPHSPSTGCWDHRGFAAQCKPQAHQAYHLPQGPWPPFHPGSHGAAQGGKGPTQGSCARDRPGLCHATVHGPSCGHSLKLVSSSAATAAPTTKGGGGG